MTNYTLKTTIVKGSDIDTEECYVSYSDYLAVHTAFLIERKTNAIVKLERDVEKLRADLTAMEKTK